MFERAEPEGDAGPSHVVENLVRFTQVLRGLGLDVPADASLEAIRATAIVGLRRRDDFRFALRAALVRRPEDLQVFDKAFRSFWKPPSGTRTKLDLQPLGKERRWGDPVVEMESLSTPSGSDGQGEERRPEFVRIATYSDRETLRQKDFRHLTANEMDQAVEMLRELRWQPAPRRSKRWIPGDGASPDLRRLLVRITRREADCSPPPRRAPKQLPRNLVLLCDISGSMERYSRMLLWFACCLQGRLPGIESFVFATRLTRITRELRGGRQGDPLKAIGRLVPDWSGGTRIGDALRTFNTRWARRVIRNGAVVLIVSDGWDRGDPEQLAGEVGRLQRSCHRLIWLTPLLGDPRYRPLTRGLVAALPHVDDFLPVHNVASLDRLALALNSLPQGSRRTASRQERHINGQLLG